MAMAILELIMFIFSSHVKCLSKYSPTNFTDSSFLYLLTWLIISLFIFMLLFALQLVFTGPKIQTFVFLTFKHNLLAHSQSHTCFNS